MRFRSIVNNVVRAASVLFVSGSLLLGTSVVRADIPVGYQGKPFDPVLVGGAGIIPTTVKAGPYPIPGRIDFINYDLGGDGIGFHTDAHYTTKGGDGYRTDRPTATLCLTAQSKPDVWYDTGTAQDGAFYPSTTEEDFYVGSIHPNDWFNYTVDVKTAGTYTISANFSTGNGPPGGEGGDGQMELIVFVNETMKADWKDTFPDYQNSANFHNWKPYPNFATLTLESGLQVIKIQAQFKHLNLDYLQFDLVGADGGVETDASTIGGAGGSGGTSSGGTSSGGAAPTAGAAGEIGVAGMADAGNSGGAGGSGGTASTGGTATGGADEGGMKQATPDAKSGGGCALAPSPSSDAELARSALIAIGIFACARRRRPRSTAFSSR